jgi:3-hydroxymyristoyl/3-hydroxydecanoyl-(acyl carrier protein) dehydratase
MIVEQATLESIQSTFIGNEWCEFISLSKMHNEFLVDAYISDDLSWFEGHFPDQPVLPGVVQTHWACELAQHLFMLEGVKKVNNLKFKTMILPNTHLSLNMKFNDEKKSVSFVFKSKDATFSTGSFVFSD